MEIILFFFFLSVAYKILRAIAPLLLIVAIIYGLLDYHSKKPVPPNKASGARNHFSKSQKVIDPSVLRRRYNNLRFKYINQVRRKIVNRDRQLATKKIIESIGDEILNCKDSALFDYFYIDTISTFQPMDGDIYNSIVEYCNMLSDSLHPDYLEPLTYEETLLLSQVRRSNYLIKLLRTCYTGYNINQRYRASLDANGRWDSIAVEFSGIFSMVTELLRYKRHEWSVWILTDEFEAKYIWSNKGDDNKSCYFKGDFSQLISLAQMNNLNTVVHFHNHPHTLEQYWDLLEPSDVDIQTYYNMKLLFNNAGLNYISAICSQGEYRIFGKSFSETFYPASHFLGEIEKENDEKCGNIRLLHYEIKQLDNSSVGNPEHNQIK